MRYVDDSKQELLVSTTQFPALVIAHQSYDKARYHWHSGLEVLYAKDCPIVFCQVGVGRFGVSFSPCERRVSGRFGVGRSCWLLVIALVIA